MRRWKPQTTQGRWIALGLLVATLGLAALTFASLARALTGAPESWPVSLGLFAQLVALLALFAAAGALIYRFVAALTLAYEIDRNGIYIVWLGNRAVVPLDRITHVDVGARLGIPLGAFQRIGYYWGRARLTDGAPLHLFTTVRPERSLVIHTTDGAYAISPGDHEAFVQDLEQRRNLGATKPLAPALQPSRMFLYDFWNDATVRALLLGALLVNLAALGLLAARYPELAPQLEMRFDAAGEVSGLRPRHQALFLPLAAFGLGLLNTVLGLAVYRRERLAARLLQGASVIVQILFAAAVVDIIL
jgi:hypothetical protein